MLLQLTPFLSHRMKRINAFICAVRSFNLGGDVSDRFSPLFHFMHAGL